MYKKCFKCGEIKDINEFYAHSGMSDGHLGKCKECTKKDSRDHGSDPEYEKRRANLPHRVALRKAYQLTERGKEAARRGRIRYSQSEHGKKQKYITTKKYREKNPLKYAAHIMVGNAVRNGLIKKLPCEKCGADKTHAHHEDYYKPLEIIWLCPSCHKKRHDKN